eukprot:591301-Amphidinium_carterae.1
MAQWLAQVGVVDGHTGAVGERSMHVSPTLTQKVQWGRDSLLGRGVSRFRRSATSSRCATCAIVHEHGNTVGCQDAD